MLLCAATPFEIEPTRQFVERQNLQEKVHFVITGIGAMAATYYITRAINSHKPALLLQAGVAGCFDENLALGTTVAVSSECVGDLGVVENKMFTSIFDLGLTQQNDFPWKDARLFNPHIDVLQKAGLQQVNSVTVNEITTNDDRIRYYKSNLGAGIENMEGAALHFVGLKEDIPFLQVRAISNYIGERDKSKWLLQKAIENLNTNLQKVLKKLMKP
jgi:futalosine hydrolase